MTVNRTNKMYGTLWVQRLATMENLCQYKNHTIANIAAKKNRHKYWYCQCTACQKIYVVRGDYLNRKVCKCQKSNTD